MRDNPLPHASMEDSVCPAFNFSLLLQTDSVKQLD